MAQRKVTFTLDEATLERLARSARQLDRPKSQVVREAIRDFSERLGRLSETERLAMLRAFDELIPQIPEGSAAAVDAEIQAVRKARRGGGRQTPGGAREGPRARS